uniref:SFRICE_019696 n=1 Tax=Spodoptera frugiperda TaxID=7108 RepID=A0A2H1V4L7_SPOFR
MELLTFIAIQILMGVVHMPSYTDYWSRRLRYTNIEKIWQNYPKINEEQNFSIDEMMTPYKGTTESNRRQ